MAQSRKHEHRLSDENDSPMIKRRKVAGPCLPLPSSITGLEDQKGEHSVTTATTDASNYNHEAGSNQEDNEDSEDNEDEEDGYGPSLPPPAGSELHFLGHHAIDVEEGKEATGGNNAQRDEWMLSPPQPSGVYSTHLPGKLEGRKFQGGRSAKISPNPEVDASWTETPGQRLKRLQDEAMGLRPSIPSRSNDVGSRISRRGMGLDRSSCAYDDELPVHDERPPLASKEKQTSAHDNANNRSFDWQTDMAISPISGLQREQILNKASDSASRFSGGRYL